MSSYLITSTKKSSGKTIITIGLSALLREMKYKLSVFKKGPDYIDPLWISQASGCQCYNLDFNTMSNGEIKKLYMDKTKISNISIVEGNKGLFDGVSLDGSDSNAQLAKFLNLKTILVIDCAGITRGIAPLVNGYEQFDKNIKYKGIILNNIATDRHEGKIINALKEYTNLKVIGSVHKNSDLNIIEQHLGLEPSFLKSNTKTIKNISSIIKSSIDYKYLVKGLKKKKMNTLAKRVTVSPDYSDIKLGVAFDNAFGFYYADDIDKIKSLGVKICYFNTIKNKKLPKVDALLIGGGFPELFASKLNFNKNMMESIKDFVEANKPVYAECGGLMYLAKSIKYNNKTIKMVGAIDGKVVMNSKPVGRGYVELAQHLRHPWPMESDIIRAHEFHYSNITLNKKINSFAYKVKRGYGINGKYDGVLYKNLLATYSHLRDTNQSMWIKNYLQFVKNNKKS